MGTKERERVSKDIASMEVFLMIKRNKTAIFLDFKETQTVTELKKVLEGIVKKSPDDIRLVFNKVILKDAKTLSDCGLTKAQTKAQTPAELGMAYRGMDGEFEEVNIVPVSTPPELPVQMKQQELPAAGSCMGELGAAWMHGCSVCLKAYYFLCNLR